MSKRTINITIAAGAAAVAAIASVLAVRASADGHSDAASQPSAKGFSARVDNQWFPLKPGTRYVYTGVKDGQPSRDVVTVTGRVRTIQGVPCVVVLDRLYLRDVLRERTTDWYSQDSHGNVWYFGEDTAELDKDGNVTSTSGTWMAGLDGAKAGIYMPAHPHLGQEGVQEHYPGEAEDHFQVIGLFGTVTAPGTKQVLLTKEWTPLEPDVVDHKMYALGIGTVLEQAQKGDDERAELVSVTTGG
jgi:hypothetical protein